MSSLSEYMCKLLFLINFITYYDLFPSNYDWTTITNKYCFYEIQNTNDTLDSYKNIFESKSHVSYRIPKGRETVRKCCYVLLSKYLLSWTIISLRVDQSIESSAYPLLLRQTNILISIKLIRDVDILKIYGWLWLYLAF